MGGGRILTPEEAKIYPGLEHTNHYYFTHTTKVGWARRAEQAESELETLRRQMAGVEGAWKAIQTTERENELLKREITVARQYAQSIAALMDGLANVLYPQIQVEAVWPSEPSEDEEVPYVVYDPEPVHDAPERPYWRDEAGFCHGFNGEHYGLTPPEGGVEAEWRGEEEYADTSTEVSDPAA